MTRMGRLSWKRLMGRLSWLVMMMFWLQTITHVQVNPILELWFSIIYHKIKISLARIPIPDAENFI